MGASALFMTCFAILRAVKVFQLAFSDLFAGGSILSEREALLDMHPLQSISSGLNSRSSPFIHRFPISLFPFEVSRLSCSICIAFAAAQSAIRDDLGHDSH